MTTNPFAQFAQPQPPTQNPFAQFAPAPPAAAPAPAPAAPAPQPTAFERAIDGPVRVGGLGSQETVRGISNLLGLPVDLINMSPMLLNLLPGEQGIGPISDNPIGGADFIFENIQRRPVEFLTENVENPIREAIGIEPAPSGEIIPQGPLERVFARTMQEVGAASVPMAGLLAYAPRVGVQNARQMGGPLGQMLESTALNPGRTTAMETYYAGAAGAGAGTAREMVSDGDPNTDTTAELWADILGAIGGAGTAAGVRYGATGLNDAAGAALGTSGYTTRVVRDAVTDELIRASGDNSPLPTGDTLLSEISNGTRISDVVPGFRETLADRTANAGIANLEYGRQSGPNAGFYTARRNENAAATQGAINELQPNATPGAFSDALTRETEAYIAQVSNEAAAATRAADAAAEPLAPIMGGEDRGQVVRGALDEALATARREETEAWSGIGGEVDPAPLASAFDSVTDNLTAAERQLVAGADGLTSIPQRLAQSNGAEADELQALIAQVFGDGPEAPEPGLVDLREVTTLRGALSEQVRTAQDAGESNLARVLNQYVAALDGYLDNAAPDQASAIEAARDVSRQLNDRFTRPGDPVAGAVRRGQGGVPRMPDSRVAPTFLQPEEGEASRITRLLTETNGSPEVREAMRDQILADVRARNLLGNEEALNRYLGQYRTAFDQFPELRQELGSAAALRVQADAAALRAEQELTRLTQQGRSTVANYLSYGDERAADAMASVRASRDPSAAADELLSMVDGNPDAIEGARRAFWSLMEREARSSGASTRGTDGSQPWRPQSLYNFLDNPANAAVAERLYRNNPEHLANLREIAEATRLAGTASTARAPNSSGTPQAIQGNAVLPSAETLGSRAFAVQRGQVGVGFASFNIAAVIARRAVLRGNAKAYQRLLDDALLNPEVARLLVQENNPANRAALARGARLWFGSTAGEVLDLLEIELDEEDDDPTISAIMEGAPPPPTPGPMRMELTDPGNQRRNSE